MESRGEAQNGAGAKKYRRLWKNTAIFTAGTFISKLLVFLLLPLYTGCLSAEEYGTADLIANLANFLIPIFCCGISEGLLRFSLRDESVRDKGYTREGIFSASTVITGAGSLLLLLLLPLLSFVDGLSSYGLLVVLYVIASNFHSVAAEYVRACEKTTLYAAQGVLNTALVIVSNLVLLLGFNLGIVGYVLSIVLADAITTVVLVFAARLDRAFSLKSVKRDTLRALLAFSLPLIPGTILWWIISVSDRYLLTYFSGGETNGLYVAAAKIPTLLTLLCTVFLTAWKISAVVEDSGEDTDAVREKSRFYSRVYRGFIAVLFSMASGIILFSKLFSRILFAESYYTAWAFIPILTVGTVFYSLSRFLGSVYFVKRKSLQVSLTAGASALLNVVLNLALIPRFGGFGAAAATFAAYFLEFVIRDVNSKRYLAFDTHRRSLFLASILLVLNAAVVSLALPYWLPASLLLTALMLLLEGREILKMVKGLLDILLRSRKVYK